MEVIIHQIKKQDFNTARKFAIEGMHLRWHVKRKIALYLYSKYFWCGEISKATRAYGAYIGDNLVGVLLVKMKGEKTVYHMPVRKKVINIFKKLIGFFYDGASGAYDSVNREMLKSFQKRNISDGELNFFAVNPEIKGKGIGSKLLNRLQEDEAGKRIFLYTDSGSTYQFYEHRGFQMEECREVELNFGKRKVPLTCYLFSKIL